MNRKTTGKAHSRALLATMTNEAVQPVRLYYQIHSRSSVTYKLKHLKCMVKVPHEQCWQWQFEAEAASLQLPGGYEDVPWEKRPIVLGRICFPKEGCMTLETNSIERAIQGAKFFAPRLGLKVVLLRVRIVNRWFAGDELPLSQLMKTLNQDVTVVDPRRAEAEFEEHFKDVRSIEEFSEAATSHFETRLQRGDDVPLVEDFPLAPEEETPDFRSLAVTLQLRSIRALEHWQGNTHITLAAIIKRTVERSLSEGGSLTSQSEPNPIG